MKTASVSLGLVVLFSLNVIGSIPSPTGVLHHIEYAPALDGQAPAIDGHRVVWAENRYGTDSNPDYDIFMYDLETCTTTCLTYKSPGNQHHPDISGDLVVWEDDRTGTWYIRGKYITAGPEFVISTNSPGFIARHPSVEGDQVVWSEHRAAGNNLDIMLQDVSTMNPPQVICGATCDQDFPQIEGNYVVWHDGRNTANERDIYGYNLWNQTEYVVYAGPGVQAYPEKSGNMVVWVDSDTPSGTLGVYRAELGNFQVPRFLVVDGPGDQTHPAIDGSQIVWADNQGGSWAIRGLDLNNPTPFDIHSSGENPAISDNFVVWDNLIGQVWSDVSGMALGELPWKSNTLLDFEYYYQTHTEITNQYPGVVFDTPGLPSVKPQLIDHYVDTTAKGAFTSGWKGLRCGHEPDYGGQKLGMEFTKPQREVSFALGNQNDTYTIFVYDAIGFRIFTQIESVNGDDVYKEVTVRSTSANIKRIEIHASTWGNSYFTIDDLRFDTSGGCACMDFNKDRIVQLEDFAAFARCWLVTIP